jgi:hypothetical protein
LKSFSLFFAPKENWKQKIMFLHYVIVDEKKETAVT